MSKSSEFQIKPKGTQEDPILLLSGQLIADAALPINFSSRLNSVTFDLSELTRINSMGVRQWDRWMVSIRKANSRSLIKLEQIPSFFIDLFNVIHEFVPRPYMIDSFYVEYFCDDCEKSFDCLIERDGAGKLPGKLTELPQIDCEVCGKPLHLDLDSDRGLSFLLHSE